MSNYLKKIKILLIVPPLSIERFSYYYYNSNKSGINNMRPLAAYNEIFPEDSKIRDIAYHFQGDYHSAFIENKKLTDKIEKEISLWRKKWTSDKKDWPELTVNYLADDMFMLIDTRGLPDTQEMQFINYNQAKIALLEKKFDSTGEVRWAIDNKIGVKIGSKYIPLAVSRPESLIDFESGNFPQHIRE